MSDPNGHKRCPCVKTSDGVSLPVVSVFCDVQVNAVVATVRVVSVYRNPSQSPVSGVYTASNSFGEATVTSCDVSFAGRRFVTAVIDPSEVAVENTDGKFQNMLHFLMPFHGLPGYSDMSVELTYIQQLSFAPQGYYEIEVPLMVPPDVQIPAGVNSSILCTLDVGSVNCVWEVPTHRMAVVSQSGSYCCLQSTDSRANNVFHLKLNVLSSSIACSCVAQPNEPSSALPGGSFMTFISPPEAQYLPSDRIGRNMVFLFDRSGSMTGDAIQQAASGLVQALHLLQPEDKFALCAFNDEQQWFGGNPTLHSVSGGNVAAAAQWVGGITAGGLTNILAPYKAASELLTNVSEDDPKIFMKPAVKIHPEMARHSLPFIFLITDGAVQNEVGICQYAEKQRMDRDEKGLTSIRTFTFGIGPYVNQTFLKTLAAAGRGHSHICLHASTLQTSVLKLMNKTTRPLLIGITLVMATVNLGIEVFPFPIPDLYQGCPVDVAGQWTGIGPFPSMIIVCGRLSSGESVSFNVTVRSSNTGFLSQALASYRIDSIVSSYWMRQQNDNEKEELKRRAIEASIASSIPCVFTQSVAYETTDFQPSRQSPQKPASKKMSTSNSAAMIGGSAVLLGAAVGLMAFGSIAATNGNLNVSSTLEAIANGLFDPAVLGGLAADVGNMVAHGAGAIGNALQPVSGAVAQGVGIVGEAVQPVASMMLETVEDAAAGAGECCTCCCSNNCCDTSCCSGGGECAVGCCEGGASCMTVSCNGIGDVCAALDGLGGIGDFGGACTVS